MNTYKITRTDWAKVETGKPAHIMQRQYWQATTTRYCNGLKEAREICGGGLHRYRHGWGGLSGSVEYVVTREA